MAKMDTIEVPVRLVPDGTVGGTLVVAIPDDDADRARAIQNGLDEVLPGVTVVVIGRCSGVAFIPAVTVETSEVA